MWNYNFVVPSVILLTAFLAFYLTQPHLPISKNRAFLRILVLEMLIIPLDLVSSRLLEDFGSHPRALHLAANTAFFLAFIARTALFFQFSAALSGRRSRRSVRMALLAHSVCAASAALALANLFTPTLFSLDGGYSRGPLYNAIYACAFFYVALSAALLVARRRRMQRATLAGALAVNAILLAGYAVRLAFPRLLVMDFFILLAIVVMYLSFENSAIYTERRTGAFSMEALPLLLDEVSGRGGENVLGIIISNYNDMREIYSGEQMDGGLSLIAGELRRLCPGSSLFYIHSGRFVVVGRTGDVGRTKEAVRERFRRPWAAGGDMELCLDVRFVEVRGGCAEGGSDALLNGLLAAFNSIGSVADADMEISGETLRNLERSAEIKRAVRRAVKEDGVEMFLQPLVDAGTRRLVGAEALARVRGADGRLIPPSLFIPVAERNGHINVLGEQMFEKACRFAATHDMDALGLSWINVNLSPLQFLRSDISSRFAEILGRHGVGAERIHLEITEEAMIDYAVLQKQIQGMNRTGFKFVLDDFGAGYSNVTRIRKYPFTNIKIDMEVVWEYFRNREEILPALVGAFKHMGFSVTAEGIEDGAMADGMRDLGCDFLQGYLFSPPVPAEEFAERTRGLR